jgi:GTP cyclohydrolase II
MTTLTQDQIQQLLVTNHEHECEGMGAHKVCVRIEAIADLPTRFGDFQIVAFSNTRDEKEHIAVVRGSVLDGEDVPVRLHSECLTGDVIGSLRCDCRDQLEAALKLIGNMESGLVLYLRQEGRGIGLVNKVRAYSLQDQGLDTVEANQALGFRDDERDYAVAAHMLVSLRVRSIRLITNNPRKMDQLSRLGVTINGRIPQIIQPNQYNRFYLETKAAKSGHWIDFRGHEHLSEQADLPILEGMSPDVFGGPGVDKTSAHQPDS